MKLRWRWLVLLLCALAWPALAERRFHAADVSGTYWGRQLTAPDHDGQVRRLEDFRGRLVVVSFGYLQCPNFCPTTLAKMAEVRRLLGPDAERVQVIFVTLDSERDSAAALKDYVRAFDPGFLGLRPEGAALAALTQEFRVYLRKVPGLTAGNYSIDHTVSQRVLDGAGRIRLRVAEELSAAQIAEDLRRLLAESAPSVK